MSLMHSNQLCGWENNFHISNFHSAKVTTTPKHARQWLYKVEIPCLMPRRYLLSPKWRSRLLLFLRVMINSSMNPQSHCNSTTAELFFWLTCHFCTWSINTTWFLTCLFSPEGVMVVIKKSFMSENVHLSPHYLFAFFTMMHFAELPTPSESKDCDVLKITCWSTTETINHFSDELPTCPEAISITSPLEGSHINTPISLF